MVWAWGTPGDPEGVMKPGTRIVLLGAAALLVAAACGVGADSREAIMLSEQLGQEEAAGMESPFAPGSPEEAAALARFSDLFSVFTPEAMREKVRAVYAEDVYFYDTLKEVRGVDALEAYLVESAEALEAGRVEVRDVAQSQGNYYVRWVMELQFKKMRRGRMTRSVGISHLRFNAAGKIVYHRDYWDAAGGLFEHIPVVGWMIRVIKGRL